MLRKEYQKKKKKSKCVEMTIQSSILTWKIPWPEEPAGCGPWDHKESDTTERLNNNHQQKCLKDAAK